MDLARTLELVGGHLDGEDVRWAVCGGLGMAAYGQVRTTFEEVRGTFARHGLEARFDELEASR